MGARKALEEISSPQEKQKWLSLTFIGCDGLPKTGQAWVRTGQLTATVIVPPMAGQAVQLMTKALRTGTTVAERTVTLLESFPPIGKLSKFQLVGVQ